MGETGRVKPVICPTTEAEYFCAKGWTGICPTGADLPVGCLRELRSSLFRARSDRPSPLVDVELYQALVPHFQQERLARLFIRNVGAFHDFVDFERLLAERAQDLFSFIQHHWTPTITTRNKSLTG